MEEPGGRRFYFLVFPGRNYFLASLNSDNSKYPEIKKLPFKEVFCWDRFDIFSLDPANLNLAKQDWIELKMKLH